MGSLLVLSIQNDILSRFSYSTRYLLSTLLPFKFLDFLFVQDLKYVSGAVIALDLIFDETSSGVLHRPRLHRIKCFSKFIAKRTAT